MIIVNNLNGQLGNQLWAAATMIAWAKECNASIIVVFSCEYDNVFDLKTVREKSRGKVTILYQMKSKLASLIWHAKKFKWLGVRVEDFVREVEFKRRYKPLKLYFVSSWNQTDNKEFFKKNSSYVKSLFKPHPSIITAVENTINKEKLTIAVHMRRGDYKHAYNGIYYYDDEVYLNYMLQVQKLFNKEVSFRIFSNEPVNLNSFKDLDIIYIPGCEPFADIWAMSKCNYIMGPPSSFSMWASFIGDVPAYVVTCSNNKISLSCFKKFIAFDQLDGGIFWGEEKDAFAIST